jgi:hypothetical protein
MAKLRRNIKGQNGGRNGGESENLGAEFGRRKAKKGPGLSGGRFDGGTFSEQLFFVGALGVMFCSSQSSHFILPFALFFSVSENIS